VNAKDEPLTVIAARLWKRRNKRAISNGKQNCVCRQQSTQHFT
jgi:hypothetical protein